MDNIWAIRDDAMEALRPWFIAQATGETSIEGRIPQQLGRPPKAKGAIGVLPIYGPLLFRTSRFDELFGFQSIETLEQAFLEMVADDSISNIILDVDSPGGSVCGVMEFADQIYNARGKKRITAIANPGAASAAYHLFSAAQELIVAPSGSVGSIGVFMMHQDFSEMMKADGVNTTFIKAGEYKTEGNPFQPLTEEAKEAFQARVDKYYDYFVKAVARNRGVSPSVVKTSFGQGRMVMAEEAVRGGMADRIGTLKGTLSRLTGGQDLDASRTRASLLTSIEVDWIEREHVLRQMEIDSINF